jgi:drug/metabolite transporter (DMT)-like permease
MRRPTAPSRGDDGAATDDGVGVPLRPAAAPRKHDSIFCSLKTIGVLVFWFACTVSVLLHNKTVLDAHILSPLQITFGQSAVSVLADLALLAVFGCLEPQQPDGRGSIRGSSSTKCSCVPVARALARVLPSAKRRRELMPLVVAFVLTKMLTLYSISLIPASLTYTIKASSPIFTVIFAYLTAGKVFSWMTYLSLVPISLGVAMSASSRFDVSLDGLACVR